ncbi:hypothetical protein DL765_009469 [Monosporascus sp. GIB2]|nr:hypothetical protein DL765_009469 [Monosporascus sp. GIB2]
MAPPAGRSHTNFEGVRADIIFKLKSQGKRPSTNAIWQLALVAGSCDNAEYLIINVRTGYFLTSTADKTIASTPQISPADPTCHWTINLYPYQRL